MGKYKDYEPEFLGVFLSLLVLNLWYLSSVAIDNNFIPVSYNFIINSLIALVSTFVGAYSAFSLNNRKETKKIYIENKTALNKAIFIVSMMMNAVPIRNESHIKFEDTDKSRAERAFSEPAKKIS